MQQTTINTFQGGLDLDTTPDFIDASKYTNARNISLTGDGEYAKVQNITGTSSERTVLPVASFPTGSSIIAAFECNGYDFSASAPIDSGTLIFANVSNALNIYINYSTLTYLVYEGEVGSVGDYVDAVSYTENSIDTFYFTDGLNELRQLSIEIPAGTSSLQALPSEDPILTTDELSTLRRACYTDITIQQAQIAGSLLCGSYQFAVRLFNNENNRYSKWTIPTVPYNISKTPVDDRMAEGGIGVSSGAGINLTIDTDATRDESGLYTHFEIAVIEYISLLDPIQASLLEPVELTGAANYTVAYKQNYRRGLVNISDIVVDKAAIKSCRTLEIRDNRLFLGGIVYHELDYDSEPTVTGSVQTSIANQGDYSRDDFFSSIRKSYMRGETYRFYVSYFDEYYNFSPAKVLDMSAITDNLAGAVLDMRFPSQTNNVAYSYYSPSSKSNMQALGLDLTINNHPTWAKGFVILRAKRIKRIEFQTPLIPATSIDGAKVSGDYPTTARENNPAVDVEYLGAQPMNPLGTYVPKNFFYGVNRSVGVNVNGQFYATNLDRPGNIFYIAPPTDTLDDEINAESFKLSGQSIRTVDVAFVKYRLSNYEINPGGYAEGDSIDTSLHGTFYSTNADDYYYSGVSGTKPLPVSLIGATINDYTSIPYGSDQNTLGGAFISAYSNLETTVGNQTWGTPPTAQKLSAIQINSVKSDASYFASVTGGGLTVPGGGINNAHYPTTPDNTFCFDRTGGAEATDYVNAVEIVNVLNDGIGDDRYGDESATHELVYTGASHIFTTGQLTTVEAGGSLPINLDVWGGDTYIGLYQIKITDSHYGLQDSADAETTLIAKWDRYFQRAGSALAYTLLVPYKNLSQIIAVALESEHRFSVLDSPKYSNGDGGTNTYKLPASESELRAPLTYFYNGNYDKLADSKAFVPYSEFRLNDTIFNSRIAYSNQRIYQSDTVGFDNFNALDFYDLDEKYGNINSLRIVGDRLISLQERAAFYVPVNARVLESSDALSLSVRSAEVIDNPSLLTTYGVTSPVCSLSTPNFVYFTDTLNNNVFRVSKDLSIENISNMGIKSTSDLSSVGVTAFDKEFNKLYIYNKAQDRGYIFDERYGRWETSLSYNNHVDHMYSDESGNLNVLGYDQSDNLMIGIPSISADGFIFGNQTASSFINFAVNDNILISKTFDNFIVYGNDIDSLTITSNGLGSTMSYDTYPDRGENVKFIPVGRDIGGGRIRGVRSLINVNFKNSIAGSITAIGTKYRPSRRIL